VSGILSIPSTLVALVVASGALGKDQEWWNSKWALLMWFVIALCAWAWTGYSVWARERNQVISLHGRPQVALKAVIMGDSVNAEPYFQLHNDSPDLAVDIKLSPIKNNSFEIHFSPVGSVGKNYEGVAYQVSCPPYKSSIEHSNLMMLAIWQSAGEHPQDKIFRAPTVMEFSNYGHTKTWNAEYVVEFHLDEKRVVCVPGSCSLKSAV
jgi:hypothetical protein